MNIENQTENVSLRTPPSGVGGLDVGGLDVGGLKQEIRKKIRQLKSSYTPDDLAQMSHKLCAKVINTPQWHNASTVLLYSSLSDEVNTDDLINAAQREKKRILLPVVVGDDLILREFTGEYALGAFNIKEPTGSEFKEYFQIDLAIIPGMAFDYNTNRLGRGKGYYDRLLSRLTTSNNSLPTGRVGESLLLGLCFPFQYINKQDISKNSPFGGWGALPFGGWGVEPHDIKMDSIIYSYE